MIMSQFKGVSRKDEINNSSLKKDTRNFFEKYRSLKQSPDGLMLLCFAVPLALTTLSFIPFSAEIISVGFYFFARKNYDFKRFHFDFPYRVPRNAKVLDGSKKGEKLGDGIALLGTDLESGLPIYEDNSDSRTHHLVLGTTGSGKTEFLLGLVANALVQNTGFIYVDGKGDPKLQKEIFRLMRIFGRELDGLIINFIMSGRDLVDKQTDKITHTMNIMGNTSSGMLIELIVSLMDDSGGGGDMWKGRAISFVAALTRPLVYLRDKGFINLSPEEFLNYFELHVLEELVFEHNGKYGDNFDFIVAPLKSYLKTLPGYQDSKRKKQETKTLEQHGFIVMQLTRIFNDLTFNYGHIFKVKIGDVDFFDVVVNRRGLVALLPALERAPDSMKMLGKMIVGAIKQMMAGCLGNRVEGVVREIIDSRPTNSEYPFYTILDEYGYYAVIGFAVAPAQARSIGFSITFAAQDFSSLKKSSAEEADATWENTNVRAIGRLTSGEESETWRRIVGAGSSASQAEITSYDRSAGTVSDKYHTPNVVTFTEKKRVNYDDLAAQQDGEFHYIIGKKEKGGKAGGVRVIRGMSFYTASEAPKEMRICDFVPVEPPEPHELPETKLQLDAFVEMLQRDQLTSNLDKFVDTSPMLDDFSKIIELNQKLVAVKHSSSLSNNDLTRALLGYYCKYSDGVTGRFKMPVIHGNDVTIISTSSSEQLAGNAQADDDLLSLPTQAEAVDATVSNLDPDALAQAEETFDILSGDNLTEELLSLAQDDLFITDSLSASDEGSTAHSHSEISLTDDATLQKDDAPGDHTVASVNETIVLSDVNARERYLSRVTVSQVEGFNTHIKAYFDFSAEPMEASGKDTLNGLNKGSESSRQMMSAMYHAQLMSIFSRGEKPSAKQIRELKDDVENEYQQLLNSTSYLNGVEPEKADADMIRQSISSLGDLCGSLLLNNLKE